MRKLIPVLLLTAMVAGCGTPSTPDITVTAQFTDAAGLYVGNDVAVLGVPVGTVTDVRPDGTQVKATLKLKPGTRIPAGAMAVTVSPSVVTDRHIELTPVYRNGPQMADGDVIPVDRTKTPVEIDRVLAAVDRLTGELSKTDGGKSLLADAQNVATANLAGNGEKMKAALDAAAKLTDIGVANRDALMRLIRNVDQLTTAAAQHEDTIRSFTGNLATASSLVAEQAPQLTAALQQLTALLDETTVLVGANKDTLRETLRKARTSTDTLAAHQNELAEGLDQLPLMLDNLSNAVDPTTGRARIHVNGNQVILNKDILAALCSRIGNRLPGCQTGKLGDFGPDLGITELLLRGSK
ncbi:MCE family protein [Pseudonocardiaceae bacterium YIM PH 21723]|nr:MCE family protein [Pseudonocardiaceae bacterium YIM PH 21723]